MFLNLIGFFFHFRKMQEFFEILKTSYDDILIGISKFVLEIQW